MASPFESLPMKVVRAGDVIFRQGDDGQGEAYLLHEGVVEVTKEEDGETRVLRTLKKGDLLGEVALFRNAPHSATATATEGVELIVIPADQLEQMVLARPGLALALIKELARMAAGDIGPESGG